MNSSVKSTAKSPPTVYAGLFAASVAVGAGAGFYFRSMIPVCFVGGVCLLVLSTAYSLLALHFRWPRLRWKEFLRDAVNLMFTLP